MMIPLKLDWFTFQLKPLQYYASPHPFEETHYKKPRQNLTSMQTLKFASLKFFQMCFIHIQIILLVTFKMTVFCFFKQLPQH